MIKQTERDKLSTEPREFVPPEVTPRRIREFYENSTAVQAHESTKHYIGKWMRISGPLGNVLPRNEFFQMVTFKRGDYPLEQRAEVTSDVYMYFYDDAQIERVSRLRVSDLITVEGQIDRMDGIDVHLKYCELVDVTPHQDVKKEAVPSPHPLPKPPARKPRKSARD